MKRSVQAVKFVEVSRGGSLNSGSHVHLEMKVDTGSGHGQAGLAIPRDKVQTFIETVIHYASVSEREWLSTGNEITGDETVHLASTTLSKHFAGGMTAQGHFVIQATQENALKTVLVMDEACLLELRNQIDELLERARMVDPAKLIGDKAN